MGVWTRARGKQNVNFLKWLLALKRAVILNMSSLDHVLLPQDGSSWRVVGRHQVVALGLCLLAHTVPAGSTLKVSQVGVVPPCSRHHLMVPIFHICYGVLACWVTDPHEVVEAAAGRHDLRHSLRSLLHHCKDDTESVRQNAKGILDYSSGSWQAVVEEPFFYSHIPPGEGLHHPAWFNNYFISNYPKWFTLYKGFLLVPRCECVVILGVAKFCAQVKRFVLSINLWTASKTLWFS